jgi:hypothetical protein
MGAIVSRLTPIQEISIKGRAETFPRDRWIALCKTFGLQRTINGHKNWFSVHGTGFILRASDVVRHDSKIVPPTWEIRLEALGKLDADGLKVWVELCLGARVFVEKSKLKDVETSVT